MKINKRNPIHWLLLLAFGLFVALAIVLRPFMRAQPKPLVLLYGHKLNGNLKSLYDRADSSTSLAFNCAFLTLDPCYFRELRAQGCHVVLAASPAAIIALSRARCIVSDHGLHAMWPLPIVTNIRFVDVLHAIPFKGWDFDEFRTQRRYDEVWVSSALIKELYVTRYGFRSQQVFATGYGRTDCLVGQTGDVESLRVALGVPSAATKLILFAPTWQHESASRSIFPFALDPAVFFAAITAVCEAHNALCLFRTHLNSALPESIVHGAIRLVSAEQFADTELVLQASDVLICDWSSIAFDYLLLDRPTIFLDVPPPFSAGFTLGPEYRFGALVKNLAELSARLELYLRSPDHYRKSFGADSARIRAAIYDDLADGDAAGRYLERLSALIQT